MESFWQRLRSRKMVEWAIGYLAAAFALLQLADFMKETFAWPTSLLRVLTVVVAFGFIAALVIAWYHGERGHQRMPPTEVVLLASTAALGIAVAWYVGANTPAAQVSAMPEPTESAPPALLAFDPATAGNSVAVLPFRNLTPDAENDYIADGITEDIITRLGMIEDLRVISHTSVLRYRNTEKSVREIGAELGVKTILEGSVRVQGNRIRIVAQLIDVATDGHLWAETYDLELEDVLAVQAQVAQAIAKALDTELMPQAVASAEEVAQADPETFRLYSMGKSLANSDAPADREKAIQALDSAVQRDPDFAPALSELVSLRVPVMLDADAGSVAGNERMMEMASRAARLNPRSAEARSALAFLRVLRDHDIESAERMAQEAVQANPNSVHARMRYAQILFAAGKNEQAMQQINAAVALDPFSPMVHGHAGELAFAMKNPAEAITHLQEAIRLDSTAVTPRITLATVYSEQGRMDDALAMAKSAVALKPTDPGVLAAYGSMLARAGQAEAATRVAEQLEELPAQGVALHAMLAQVYNAIGDTETAVDWLKKGASQEGRDVLFFPPRLRHTLEQMRQDPRMAKVLDSLGYRIEIRRTPSQPPTPPDRTGASARDSRSRSGDRR